MQNSSTSEISGFVLLTKNLSRELGNSVESVEGLLGTALMNYGLFEGRHNISYSKLLEIWERDCEAEIYCFPDVA